MPPTTRAKKHSNKSKTRVDVEITQVQNPQSSALTSPSLIPASQRRAASPSRSQSRCRAMFAELTDFHISRLQRLHLVIDLDATFVSTHVEIGSFTRIDRALSSVAEADPSLIDSVRELKNRIFIFSLEGTKLWTILRPGTLEFLEFASFFFNRVSIWSAGQKEYVIEIASLLFPPGLPRPGLIFTRGDCRDETWTTDKAASPFISTTQDVSNTAFTKPLEAIAEHVASEDSLKTMLILDDRSDIAKHNKDNLVLIPPFEPRLTVQDLLSTDDALDKFAEWLMTAAVIDADDIRSVDKTNIFK